MLRHTFLQKSYLHPLYGPAISYENFYRIVHFAKLLGEEDDDIKKEKNACKIAFKLALLNQTETDMFMNNAPNVITSLIKNSTNEKLDNRKKSTDNNVNNEFNSDKNIDINDAKAEESKNKVSTKPAPTLYGSSEDSPLGINDELVFAEYVEALAHIALFSMKSSRYT